MELLEVTLLSYFILALVEKIHTKISRVKQAVLANFSTKHTT